MFNTIRQFRAQWAARSEVERLHRWADGHGFDLRRARGTAGCVLEGRMAGLPGRIEWGPAQRSYVEGLELRLTADNASPPEVLGILLNRTLQERMEASVYAQYVGDVQTRLDEDAPPEMRWLILLDRIGACEMGRLKHRYGAFSNQREWMRRWLDTPLNDALAATIEAVPAAQPIVMTARRGRLLLRTPMPEVDLGALAQWLSVFEHGLREARTLGEEWRPVTYSGPDTQPATWSNSQGGPEVTELPELTGSGSVSVATALATPDPDETAHLYHVLPKATSAKLADTGSPGMPADEAGADPSMPRALPSLNLSGNPLTAPPAWAGLSPGGVDAHADPKKVKADVPTSRECTEDGADGTADGELPALSMPEAEVHELALTDLAAAGFNLDVPDAVARAVGDEGPGGAASGRSDVSIAGDLDDFELAPLEDLAAHEPLIAPGADTATQTWSGSPAFGAVPLLPPDADEQVQGRLVSASDASDASNASSAIDAPTGTCAVQALASSRSAPRTDAGRLRVVAQRAQAATRVPGKAPTGAPGNGSTRVTAAG